MKNTVKAASRAIPINTARARAMREALWVKFSSSRRRANSVTSSGASSSVKATLKVKAARTRPVAAEKLSQIGRPLRP